MSEIPRKSTVNQFKKLMKKSGKSKTNKDAGATAPNRIATYEQYFILKEGNIDLDPYGEEDWEDNNIMSEIYKDLSERFSEQLEELGYALVFDDDDMIEILKDYCGDLTIGECYFMLILLEDNKLLTFYRIIDKNGEIVEERHEMDEDFDYDDIVTTAIYNIIGSIKHHMISIFNRN